MLWFCNDTSGTRQWAMVIAVGNGDGANQVWLAGQGWDTLDAHEARGWVASDTPPTL